MIRVDTLLKLSRSRPDDVPAERALDLIVVFVNGRVPAEVLVCARRRIAASRRGRPRSDRLIDRVVRAIDRSIACRVCRMPEVLGLEALNLSSSDRLEVSQDARVLW